MEKTLEQSEKLENEVLLSNQWSPTQYSGTYTKKVKVLGRECDFRASKTTSGSWIFETYITDEKGEISMFRVTRKNLNIYTLTDVQDLIEKVLTEIIILV